MIRIRSFQGVQPAVNAVYLEPSQAQAAVNCDIQDGSLQALPGLSDTVQGLSAAETRTIVKNNNTWLTFALDTDVVKSPVAETGDRYYYSDAQDGPKKRDDALGPFDLGVDPPETALILTLSESDEVEVERSVSYVYTRVTIWGEESAPSRPTAAVDIKENQHIAFSGFNDGDSDHVTHYRIYRVAAGNESAEYLLVPYQTVAGTIQYTGEYNEVLCDIPKAEASSAVDGVDDTWLQESLPSASWLPPLTFLTGLVYAGNGIMAGFSGKQVCFSEPWLFYAWPVAYRYAVQTDVVGLGHYQGQVVALTTEDVLIFAGTTPDSLQQVKLPDRQGCISKRSLCSTRQGVLFASKDGLCLANASGVEILTRKLWTRAQWLALSPENLIGLVYNDCYYGFFPGSATGIKVPLYDLSRVITLDLDSGFPSADAVKVYGGYVDPQADNLYLSLALGYNETDLMVAISGVDYNLQTEDESFIILLNNPSLGYEGGIYEFGADAASPLTYTWTSKAHQVPFGNYPAVLLRGESGSSTVAIQADGTSCSNQVVTHGQSARLPSGFLASKWELTLSGTTRVEAVGLGHPQELNHGL